MKKNFLLLLSYALLCTTFTSCIKDTINIDDQQPSQEGCSLIPVIVADGPVELGGTLQLHAANVPNEGEEYHWSGPAGFTSEEKDPVIENARTQNAGRYTLQVTQSSTCSATVVSDSIEVTYTGPSCSPAANTGVLSGFGTLTASSVTLVPTDSSYIVTANATGGKVIAEFAGTAKPGAGVYTIQPVGGSFKYGDVRLKITVFAYTFTTGSGTVYVGNAEGKLSATFCSLTFTSPSFPTSPATASGNITEK